MHLKLHWRLHVHPQVKLTYRRHHLSLGIRQLQRNYRLPRSCCQTPGRDDGKQPRVLLVSVPMRWKSVTANPARTARSAFLLAHLPFRERIYTLRAKYVPTPPLRP